MKKYKRNKNEKEYIPKYPNKYTGMYPIVMRSSWEYKFAQWLDFNRDIIEWSNESIRIPYIDPTQGERYGILDEKIGKKRIYYPDFYAKFKNGKKFIIEIKPQKDTRMPLKKGGKSKKTLVERERMYKVNNAKFKAAKKYAEKIGMEFLVLTEKDLFRRSK
jgi:hypothetical protein